MIKTVAVLVVAFVLALAAGASLGLLASPLGKSPAASATPPSSTGERRDHSWLEDQLQLDPQQREKLRAIWEQTHLAIRNSFERRAAIDGECDDAIYNLLNDEQKARYKAIRADAQRRADDLDREVRQAFDAAEAQTREVLTPEQRQKFELLRAAHHPGHGPPPMGMGIRTGGPQMPHHRGVVGHGPMPPPPPFMFDPPPGDGGGGGTTRPSR